jgi:hypothetical protein
MDKQPAPERTPEEKAAIERGGKRWAIGIGAGLVGIAILVATYNPHHEATPAERKADAQRACQDKFIPDRLKAPATAKYTNASVTTSLGTYTVTGSVDAQNSFGAQIRSNFICIMHSDGDQWVLDNAEVN